MIAVLVVKFAENGFINIDFRNLEILKPRY